MNSYFEGLKKYAVFSGRARRSEYWPFILFSTLIQIALIVLFSEDVGDLYSLLVLLPTIAFGVRRMHDVNKNGWFLLIPIYSLILACTDGTKGPNRYGEDPKGRPSEGAGTISSANPIS
jgi:uncharacterized membrane protein YhaH (DUF805 family)